MNIRDLIDLTANELVRRIQASNALSVFAKRRAKFEGWLKVELIDILIKNGVPDVVPEHDRIDVSFGDVAIELKTVNTNFRDANAENRHRPIVKNISSVIQDIAKHRNNKFQHKFIIFVVFPLSEGHIRWTAHLTRIEEQLGGQCSSHYFRFREADGVSGCIFYGEVS